MPSPLPKRPNPADIVRASKKFLEWKPGIRPRSTVEKSNLDRGGVADIVAEKHYTPTELAELWGVSVQTIRDLFKSEDGVLKIGSEGTRNRRAYKRLRIPYSVAERVHTRLSC